MTTKYIVRIAYPDTVCEVILSADAAETVCRYGRILFGPDNVSLIPVPPARP